MLNKTVGEESVFLRGNLIHRLCKSGGGRDDVVESVLDHLGVKELFGVFPFVKRLGFVQTFITLKPDQIALQGAGDGFGQFRFADAGRSLDQHRFLGRCRQKNDCRNFPRRNISGICQTGLNIVYVFVFHKRMNSFSNCAKHR
ncbi:MAG: hypothetical protein BWX55_01126 [Deltaproteobacteria bacterium ADurb.Bin022]|nr:MAG: hypothetical protein BWX55_01126 [Deltaproteobacteria bacterium ADurb.Bin022]